MTTAIEPWTQQWRISQHQQTEITRLDSGDEGCGCDWCQELYSRIDLLKYGERVHGSAGIYYITEGSKGTHRPRRPRPEKEKQEKAIRAVHQNTDKNAQEKKISRNKTQPVKRQDKKTSAVKTAPKTLKKASTPEKQKSVTKSLMPAPPGANHLQDRVDVDKNIRDLASEGHSSREIEKLLDAAGIKISHMTISRRIKKLNIAGRVKA